MNRNRLAGVFVMAFAIVGVAVPAQAAPIAQADGLHTAGPRTALYSPGSASATRPSWDPVTKAWKYSCVFANWRSATSVTWHCDLETLSSVAVQRNSGVFYGGTKSTSVFSYKAPASSAYCAAAYAINEDGGASATKCS
jgi:hypothetical protein